MATEKKHDTCIDVTPMHRRPKSEFICGPDCPKEKCPHGYVHGDHHWFGCMGVSPFITPSVRREGWSNPELTPPRRKGRGKLWRWMRGMK